MASTGQFDINKLTPDNGAVTDLRELLFLAVLQSEDLASIVNLFPGAVHGNKIGWIGNMGLVGESKSLCNPTWNNTKIETQEKEWDLGRWVVEEQICYADLEDTLVRYAMRKKTDIADLTGTDFMDIIIEPQLTKALTDMIWRLYWFGDKSADNVVDGGIITNGIDPKYFKICDGFFKRLFAITAANPNQHVEIDANSASTYKEQREAFRQPNVATDIFDRVIYDADIRIRQADDASILCTRSAADALAIDLKRKVGSNLHWESLFNGLVSATEYNGHTIYAINKWDEMIATYEDNGTTLNKPHRILYTPKSNLFAGIASSDLVAQLKIWFSDDDQVNRMLASDQVGTLIGQDDLVQMAY